MFGTGTSINKRKKCDFCALRVTGQMFPSFAKTKRAHTCWQKAQASQTFFFDWHSRYTLPKGRKLFLPPPFPPNILCIAALSIRHRCHKTQHFWDLFCFGVFRTYIISTSVTQSGKCFWKASREMSEDFRWASGETLCVFLSCKSWICMRFVAFDPAPSGHHVL